MRMNRLFAAAILLSLTVATPSVAATPQEVCPSIGEMAATIMTARQNGVIMSTAMATVPDNVLKDLAIDLVKKAYAVPQYNVDENRARAVTEFRNDTELACYTAG